MKKINIITGKIRSGKTTYLKKLITSTKNIGGIVQPANGEDRFFSDIQTKESKELTAQKKSKDTFQLGRFLFYSESFSWARKKLKHTLVDGIETIVIDEYGPLEFADKGLEPAVSEIIEFVQYRNDKRIIIVIRETLLEDFIQKFNLLKEEVEITKI